MDDRTRQAGSRLIQPGPDECGFHRDVRRFWRRARLRHTRPTMARRRQSAGAPSTGSLPAEQLGTLGRAQLWCRRDWIARCAGWRQGGGLSCGARTRRTGQPCGSTNGTEVRIAIEQVGAGVRFLPPYSPDFNPIELAFAKLKAFLRAARPRNFEQVYSLIPVALELFTPDECTAYARHCAIVLRRNQERSRRL